MIYDGQRGALVSRYVATKRSNTLRHLRKSLFDVVNATSDRIFVRPEPDEQVAMGRSYEVEDEPFDYGAGIRQVGSRSITECTGWMLAWIRSSVSTHSGDGDIDGRPRARGQHRLMVRATNNDGAGQLTHHWNRRASCGA